MPSLDFRLRKGLDLLLGFVVSDRLGEGEERGVYDEEELLASGFTLTAMWIKVLWEYLTGGCCGAVIPPMLDLAMAGKGSLGAIFREYGCACFCDRRLDAEGFV
jgi:hypothetical protein